MRLLHRDVGLAEVPLLFCSSSSSFPVRQTLRCFPPRASPVGREKIKTHSPPETDCLGDASASPPTGPRPAHGSTALGSLLYIVTLLLTTVWRRWSHDLPATPAQCCWRQAPQNQRLIKNPHQWIIKLHGNHVRGCCPLADGGTRWQCVFSVGLHVVFHHSQTPFR